MIIEFNGLPGAGKTTLARELKNSYDSNSRLVCLKYDTKPKIYYALMPFQRKNIKLFFVTRRIISSLSDSKQNYSKSLYYLMKYIDNYNRFDRNCSESIYICDQGVVQAILSIFHTNLIDNTSQIAPLIKHIKQYCTGFFIVNCDVKCDIAFDRMRNRGSGLSRFDRMTDEECIKAYKIQKRNLNIIRAAFNDESDTFIQMAILTTNSPMENIEFIREKCGD